MLLSLNIAMIIINTVPILMNLLRNSAVQEETNILQESMEEGIDETVSLLDE